jgi:malonate-semialdehyde dehydrogenase (acetylating)/methylmalonate-semialdehyde dehydrogenase
MFPNQPTFVPSPLRPRHAPSACAGPPGGAMKYPAVRNYLNGAFVAAELPTLDVYDPSEGRVISRVPLSSQREVDAAVEARRRFRLVRYTHQGAVQVFYRQALLERTSTSCPRSSPRRTARFRRGPRRGAQVGRADRVRHSLPQITTGEVLEVSRGVECRIERFPLGVVAAITPFNFPTWCPTGRPQRRRPRQLPRAQAPELVPLSAGRIAELRARRGCRRGASDRPRRQGGRWRHLRPPGDRGDQLSAPPR